MFKLSWRSKDYDPAYWLKMDVTINFVQRLHEREKKKDNVVQGCASNKINK